VSRTKKSSRPTRTSSQPAETPPTDLVGIAAAAKAHPDLSESQVRLWVNRGYLPSYRHPDPLAGRRQGRGRSIQRWISASELAAFAGQKKKAAGGDPSAVNEPQP